MRDFAKLYDRFQITEEKSDNLRWLANPNSQLADSKGRIIVETVVVENGERRVIKKEEQGAKLV